MGLLGDPYDEFGFQKDVPMTKIKLLRGMI